MRVTHQKSRQYLVIALLVFVGLMGTVTASHGQSEGWSSPMLLSTLDRSGWFPDIATDMTGQVHVVWSSGLRVGGDSKYSKVYDTVMYTSSQDGTQWSKETDIAAILEGSGGEATRPTILLDRQGILHMTYRYTSVYYTQALAQSASMSSAWLSPRQISTFQIAYFSRLAIDGEDNLHLLFTQNVPTPDCPICFHIFYRWSDNNGLGWSALTDISKIPLGAAKPQILIDEQDNLHVVWEAGIGGAYGQLSDPTKVMYTASHDRGKTWTTPIEFIAPGGAAGQITIGLDGKGKLVVAWLGLPENVVYYQLSADQGRSWSPPRPIAGIWGGSITSLDDYTMATDSAGNVHLVLVGRTRPDPNSFPNLFHLSWDGTAWSLPEALTDLKGDVPEWPRIAVGNGNQLHVVWFVRDQAHIWDSENQKYQIWYTRGLSSAPPVTPVPLPTVTPTPVSEALATPTPLPTPTTLPSPTPTLDPGLARVSIPVGATGSIFTDNDELILLAKSLLPAILIIALAMAGVRVWRR